MRRRIVTLFCKAAFACVLLGMTGCSSGQDFFASIFGAPDAPAIAAQAGDAMKNGDAASAEKLYTQAMDMHTLPPPGNANALLGRGLAREKLGKRDDALADFTAALALNALPPADAARAQYDRGVALDALGRMPEAIDAFNAAIALQPDFAAAYTNRGNAHLRLGDLAGAKSDYEAALAADIASPAYVWYGLGQIAQAQGDFVGARECYEKALAADPAYGLAAARLADLDKMNLPRRLAPPPLAPQREAMTDANYTAASNAPELRPAIEGKSPAAQASGALIQLGAFRDEAMARATWNRLMEKTGGLLDGLTPSIVSVDLPDRGRFWRLRAGVSDPHAAASLCGQLKSKGFDCIEIKG
jgi:tetratricopeptide (TPR) repeat protein